MKNMKRSVALLVAIALLIGCAAGGTMAWLTMKTDSVVNTFTTSDVSITLTETEGGANHEFKMVPGATIDKDPTVTVKAGSEACWVFVKVKENNRVAGTEYNFYDYTINNTYWTKLDGVSLAAGETVYYRAQDTVANSDAEYPVLSGDQVTVSNKVTKADMALIDGVEDTPGRTAQNEIDARPTLTFTAYAIQKSGFTDAATAWGEASK